MANSLENYLAGLNLGDGTTAVAFQVFIIVFFALLLDFIQRRVLHRLEEKIESTEQLWDDALYHALRRPLSALIWLLGITFAADIVSKHTEATIFQAVGTIRELGVIAIIAWFLNRLIAGMEKNVLLRGERRGKPVDKTTVDAIGKLLRLSVIITAVLIILQTLGFSVSGVLAFGGVGGIAIGFAAKDLLANFFGGLMIYLDRPFSEGDWIRSPDRNIEGTVEKIGWRLTRIRTFDKRPLYLPNSTFTSIAVENPSRMSHRRIYETIGIRYEDAPMMSVIISDIKQMLQQHPAIDRSQTLIVNFNSFASSSLDFFIYTFTHTTDWVKYHEIKQDVLLKVVEIIEVYGAEFAFPTSTVHIPDGLNLIDGKREPVVDES
jgi:MscS family membrane protein